jgi:hypothetical protein
MKIRELTDKQLFEKMKLFEQFIYNNFDKQELEEIQKIVINMEKLSASYSPSVINLEIFERDGK